VHRGSLQINSCLSNIIPLVHNRAIKASEYGREGEGVSTPFSMNVVRPMKKMNAISFKNKKHMNSRYLNPFFNTSLIKHAVSSMHKDRSRQFIPLTGGVEGTRKGNIIPLFFNLDGLTINPCVGSRLRRGTDSLRYIDRLLVESLAFEALSFAQGRALV
jgi:hypothetical protein